MHFVMMFKNLTLFLRGTLPPVAVLCSDCHCELYLLFFGSVVYEQHNQLYLVCGMTCLAVSSLHHLRHV